MRDRIFQGVSPRSIPQLTLMCFSLFHFPNWELFGYSIPTAAAAKSLQSCPTLCDPIDDSPPGSPIPGILQARTLKWVAISFFNAWKWKVKVKLLSHVQLFMTPWTAAYQVPPSMGFSRQEYWSGVPSPSPSLSLIFSNLILWLLCVHFCMLFLPGVWWTSWISVFMVFIKLEKCLTTVSSNISLSPQFLFCDPHYIWILSHRLLVSCSFFFSLCSTLDIFHCSLFQVQSSFLLIF